jgi:hypothetical protein
MRQGEQDRLAKDQAQLGMEAQKQGMAAQKQAMGMNDYKMQQEKTNAALQLLSGVRDEQTYQQAKQVAVSQFGIDPATLPPSYDPNWVKTTQNQLLSAADRMSFELKRQEIGLRQQQENRLSKMLMGGIDPDTGREIYNPKKEKEIDMATERFSITLESTGLSELIGAAKRAKTAVEAEKGDIPGYGVVVGGFPDFAVSSEGKSIRQEISGLQNAILKARSGGAVTPQEADRMMTELGAGLGRDDALLRKGISNVTNMLADKVQNAKAGFQPEVIERYKERGGMNLDINTGGERTVVKQQYSPSRKQTRITYSDGTEEIIDGQ